MRRLPSLSFISAITGLAGPGKVGKVGQGLKRDVCGHEGRVCCFVRADSLGSSTPAAVPAPT